MRTSSTRRFRLAALPILVTVALIAGASPAHAATLSDYSITDCSINGQKDVVLTFDRGSAGVSVTLEWQGPTVPSGSWAGLHLAWNSFDLPWYPHGGAAVGLPSTSTETMSWVDPGSADATHRLAWHRLAVDERGAPSGPFDEAAKCSLTMIMRAVPRLVGFVAPVLATMGSPTWNTVKPGATVPLKFQYWRGASQGVDPADITLSVTKVDCSTGEWREDLSPRSAGLGTLRYSDSQFVVTWKPPSPGCYRADVGAGGADGLVAYLKVTR